VDSCLRAVLDAAPIYEYGVHPATEECYLVDEREWLTECFEEHWTRLRERAYRMLGSLGEADDAAKEAWLLPIATVPTALTTTVDGRLRLRPILQPPTHLRTLDSFASSVRGCVGPSAMASGLVVPRHQVQGNKLTGRGSPMRAPL
jgi:hypothetical protein